MRNTLNKYEFCGGDPIFTFPPKTKSHLQIPEEKGGHGEAPNSFQVAKNLKDSNAKDAKDATPQCDSRHSFRILRGLYRDEQAISKVCPERDQRGLCGRYPSCFRSRALSA